MELTAKLTLPDVPVSRTGIALDDDDARGMSDLRGADGRAGDGDAIVRDWFQLGSEEQYRSRRIADICEKVWLGLYRAGYGRTDPVQPF